MQRLRRLLGRRSARQAEKCFAVEGTNGLTEALASGHRPQVVYAAPGAAADIVEQARRAGADVVWLADGVLERVADAVTPQPIAAVFPFVDVTLEDATRGADRAGGASPFVIVLVGVQDPGNVGTVLRTAEAAGAAGVVCCDGTADVYNPKTVRASAGSLFHVPLAVGGGAADVAARLSARGFRCLGTAASGGADYTQASLTDAVAFLLGNEAAGLSPDLAVESWVTIPHAGRAESLNVGIAAALLCFEAARQRRHSPC